MLVVIDQQDIPESAELFTAKLGSWRDANEPDKGEGFYTFGFIDKDTVSASGQEISYTPVDSSQGFWMIDSASAAVNGKTVSQSGNTAIMDTGTTLALVSDDVCEAVYGAIPGATYDQQNQGWVYPSDTTVDQLPDVSIAIGDKQFIVQKEDLGFADAGDGTIYGGIQSRGDMTFDILGDTVLKGIYAVSLTPLLFLYRPRLTIFRSSTKETNNSVLFNDQRNFRTSHLHRKRSTYSRDIT